MKLQALVEKLSDTLHASRAFGPPIERDGITIIPVALVAGGGGGGGGSWDAEPTKKPNKDNGNGHGHGPASSSGGGFGGVSLPLGVYAVQDGNVRWVPALDATRVVLSLIGIVKLAVRVFGQAHKHAHHDHAH